MKNGKMACLILLLCTAATLSLSAQNKKTLYPNLAGKWVAKNDPRHTLLIKNGWIYESRRQQMGMDTNSYQLTKTPCAPEKKPGKKNLYLVEKNKAGQNERCYALLTYSANSFSLRPAGSDITYTFVRNLKRY